MSPKKKTSAVKEVVEKDAGAVSLSAALNKEEDEATGADGLPVLTPEEREALTIRLIKAEAKCNTIRQAMKDEMKRMGVLKRKLGLSPGPESVGNANTNVKAKIAASTSNAKTPVKEESPAPLS